MARTTGAANGQARKAESVWDYPRPPRLEPVPELLQVVHCGVPVASTRRGFRVLETSHPPVYYFPPDDITPGVLTPSAQRASFCEFKGSARYWALDVTSMAAKLSTRASVPEVGWSYPSPTPAFAPITDFVAFYAGRVDECRVDGELVEPQPGDFYGGWITTWITGPFKGPPGTRGW